MIFDHFEPLWPAKVWLLAKRTCSWLDLYAVHDTLYLALVTGPNFLGALQHGEDLSAIRLFFII